jgi:hypothetical protein
MSMANCTKKGPGRIHRQGDPRDPKRGPGFRGVSYSIPRPLSEFHPTVRAKLLAEREELYRRHGL